MKNTFIANGFISHNTGRLSSEGPNLQNIPKAHGIRQLFIPDNPDDIFMDADYRQLEVRIAAAISKDLTLIQEVRDGVDLHSRNAAQFLLGIPEEAFLAVLRDENHPDHKFYKEKRRAAKAVTFGVLYGSTANGVAQRENLPVEDCEKFIKHFFKKYSTLDAFIKSQNEKVKTLYKVTSPTGRFMKFYDLEWVHSRNCPTKMRAIRLTDVERISVNMPIQGYGSDIFQMKCLELYAFLKQNNMRSRFVLSIHDGFVLNVAPEDVQILKEKVPEIMKTTLNKGTRYEIDLEVDFGFSKKWEGEPLVA